MIHRINGHAYYSYPPGSSVLSAPFVKLLNGLGLSAVKPNGSYSLYGESRIQKVLSALLMAIFVAIVFALSRLLLSRCWALIICFATAFGTQVWSSASRGLWTHTWGLVLIVLIAYQLLAHEESRFKLNGPLLATFLAWAYFIRPTSVIMIGCVGLYLLVFERRIIVSTGITLALWLCGFVAYSSIHFGTLLPWYYTQQLGTDHFWTALAGTLISPSRGLLIFVPQLLFVVYLLIRYRKFLVHRRLISLCVVIAGSYWLVIASWQNWWGGFSYGPRLMTDMLPWLVILAVVGFRAWQDASHSEKGSEGPSLRIRRRLEYAAAAILLILSVLVNAGGAFYDSERWYMSPGNIDTHPERLWDWRDPQFLTWVTDHMEDGEHDG